MKRHLPLAALLVLAFATFCFAQDATPSPSPKPKPRMSKAALTKKLSANETALSTAWKNRDAKPFQMWLSADGVMMDDQSVGTKGGVLKMMPSMRCGVKSITLADWQLS